MTTLYRLLIFLSIVSILGLQSEFALSHETHSTPLQNEADDVQLLEVAKGLGQYSPDTYAILLVPLKDFTLGNHRYHFIKLGEGDNVTYTLVKLPQPLNTSGRSAHNGNDLRFRPRPNSAAWHHKED